MTIRILVPLDGSPAAELGLRSACRVARDSGAGLQLVRTTMFFAGDRSTYAEERRNLYEVKDYLSRLENELRGQGYGVHTDVLPSDPVRGILFAAESYDAGLISMSTHGRSGLSHALLGSVAEAVLRKCDRPLLLTRVTNVAPEVSSAAFRTVLVALDGTRFAETSLEVLGEQGIAPSADVELVRVVPQRAPLAMPGIVGGVAAEVYDDLDRGTAEEVSAARSYLTRVGRTLLQGRRCHSTVRVGSPCTEILDAASAAAADLVVVATHGRHGLDKVLYGSVALDLLRHVDVPLLVVHGRLAEVEPVPISSARSSDRRRSLSG